MVTSGVPGGRLLTYREVGQLLGVGERAALNWVREQDLPVTPGRPAKVTLADVVARAEALGRPLPGLLARDSEDFGTPDRKSSEDFGTTSKPIEAAYQVAGEAPPVALVPLATMVEELRGLADQLAELARRNEGLALEVGTLRERVAGHEGRIAAKEETIAELRRRAELAEATGAAHEPVVAELRQRVGEQDRTLAEVAHRADLAEREAATLRALLAMPTAVQDEAEGDARDSRGRHDGGRHHRRPARPAGALVAGRGEYETARGGAGPRWWASWPGWRWPAVSCAPTGSSTRAPWPRPARSSPWRRSSPSSSRAGSACWTEARPGRWWGGEG